MSDQTSSQEATPILDMREDGPLLAKHVPHLEDANGNVLAPRPLAPLCRCGASSNKPYCDGSHRDIGFRSGTPAEPEKDGVKTYRGSDVNVLYNALICSHAARCLKIAPAAFDTDKRPWIAPDRDETERVIEAVRACPSGALRLQRRDGEAEHLLASEERRVDVSRHGPYAVLNLPVAAPPAGEGASERKYVLCRCGKTSNTPYCDGSHAKAGWKDGSEDVS